MTVKNKVGEGKQSETSHSSHESLAELHSSPHSSHSGAPEQGCQERMEAPL